MTTSSTMKQKRAEAYARAKAAMAADKCKVQAFQAKKQASSVVPTNSRPAPSVAPVVRAVKKEVPRLPSKASVPRSPAKRQAQNKQNAGTTKQAAKKQAAMRRAKEYGQKDLESLLKRNSNHVSFLQDALKEEEVEEEEYLPPSKKSKKIKTIFSYTGQDPAGVCMACDDDETMVSAAGFEILIVDSSFLYFYARFYHVLLTVY